MPRRHEAHEEALSTEPREKTTGECQKEPSWFLVEMKPAGPTKNEQLGRQTRLVPISRLALTDSERITGKPEVDRSKADLSVLIPLYLCSGVQCDSGPRGFGTWPEQKAALRVRAQDQP